MLFWIFCSFTVKYNFEIYILSVATSKLIHHTFHIYFCFLFKFGDLTIAGGIILK